MIPAHLVLAGITVTGLLIAAFVHAAFGGSMIAMIFSLEVALPACVAGYFANSVGRFIGFSVCAIATTLLARLLIFNDMGFALYALAASIFVTSAVTVLAHYFRAKDLAE